MTPFWRSCRRSDYAEYNQHSVAAAMPLTGTTRHNPALGIRPDKRALLTLIPSRPPDRSLAGSRHLTARRHSRYRPGHRRDPPKERLAAVGTIRLRNAHTRVPLHQERSLFVSFGIYIVGYLIVIGGLVWGAALIHMPVRWIAVEAIVLAGLGILSGVKATRQKDSAN
jgi:hypothetical protein